METLALPETNLSTGKSETKKTLSASPRSKFRQLQRSQAAADDAVNNHSAAALTVDGQKSLVSTGNTKIDVRVTTSDDDVTRISGRTCAVSGVRSGMPATCSPTVTLLQKRREAKSPLRETGQSRSPVDGQLLNTDRQAATTTTTSTTSSDCRRRPTKGRSRHSDNRCVSVDSVIAAAVNKLEAMSTDRDSCPASDTRLDVERGARRASALLDRNTADPVTQQQTARAWSPPNASYVQKRYENRPMKIEDYEPGMSSLASREHHKVNFHNPPIDKPGQHCKYVDGSSSLRYRIRKKTRRSPSPSLSDSSLQEQYRRVQKGGDIPTAGLRCATPPRRVGAFKSSTSEAVADELAASRVNYVVRPHVASAALGTVTNRRLQDEVNAARKLELAYIKEDELKTDAVTVLQELVLAEERRKRLEQETKINQSRRHSMCFLSPNSPIALDRYSDSSERNFLTVPRCASTNAALRSKAHAIYSFQAQNNRELTLRRGDVVYLRRAVDQNWFEGEHHGLVGRFPASYVEVLVSLEEAAAVNNSQYLALVRVLHDFRPQSPYELRLRKGDVVAVVRRLDENWFEGLHDGRQGLFPAAYVEFIRSPPPSSSSLSTSSITGLTPPLSVGSSLSCQLAAAANTSSKRSSTNFSTSTDDHVDDDVNCTSADVGYASAQLDFTQPPHPHEPPATTPRDVVEAFPPSDTNRRLRVDQLPAEVDHQRRRPKSDHVTSKSKYGDKTEPLLPVTRRSSRPTTLSSDASDVIVTSPSRRDDVGRGVISTTPYYAVQAYSPCDDDELALCSGDVVHVTETFDDGWFIGISQRTRNCGSFPGTYVRKLPRRA